MTDTPNPELPPIDVKPPSDHPRWQNDQLVQWRREGARLRQNLLPAVMDANVQGVMAYLGYLGFTELTEDLLYVLWVSLPINFKFIQTRTVAVCNNPQVCASSALGHVNDGLDFAAAHLLYIEDNYLGRSLL